MFLGALYPNFRAASIPRLWRLGFGTMNNGFLIDRNFSGHTGLVVTTLLANLPQLLMSSVYLAYNGLFTCMLLAEEWSTYAYKRSFLRVTSPVGNQRSTYRLQLPYRYSIPLLLVSGLLHWLVSQSIFLARIAALRNDGVEDEVNSVSTCGWSPIAMIGVLFIGAIFILTTVAISCRKYTLGMPLVRSNSAAISAACHPPEGDQNASRRAVMWGAVKDASDGATGQRSRYYSFTSFKVEPPAEGQHFLRESIGTTSSIDIEDTLSRNVRSSCIVM